MGDRHDFDLFPYRGKKYESGLAYENLAFGSTQPRGMMPGHLSGTASESALKNIERRAKHKKHTESLYAQAAKIRERALTLSKQFQTEKQKRTSHKRHHAFSKGVHDLQKADDTLRPPDRSGFLRFYTSVDADMWKSQEQRRWYNEGAQPATNKFGGFGSFNFEDPINTERNGMWGTRGLSDKELQQQITQKFPPVERRRAKQSSPLRLSRTQHSSSVPALHMSRKPGIPRSTLAEQTHWADWEGQLAAVRQHHEAVRPLLLQEAQESLKRPWKPRAGPEEGPVFHPSMTRSREAALYEHARSVASLPKAKNQR